MSTFDAFRFDGKRVLVVGGATGMGAAAAELAQAAGAEVVVMDYAPVKLDGAQGIRVNLAEKDSIDEAVDACEGPVHALLCCAGVADGTPGIERINFIGHRHLIDHLLGHGHHRLWVAEPAGARAAARHLGDPATAVDVDEGWFGLFGHLGGFREAFGVAAVDLDSRGRVVRVDGDFLLGFAATAQQALDIDELRDTKIGPALTA